MYQSIDHITFHFFTYFIVFLLTWAQVSFPDHMLSIICLYVSKIFSRTYGPISIKLGSKHPWVTVFLAHLSQGSSELFWSKFVRCCCCRCRRRRKLFTFSSSSPEPLGQFQPNLAQSILGWRGFKFVQMKGPALFQGEIITK